VVVATPASVYDLPLTLSSESNIINPAIMIDEILGRVDIKGAAIIFVVVLAVLKVTQWINASLKIRSLGGRAYRVKTWLPAGM
jgi:hypothetical protein